MCGILLQFQVNTKVPDQSYSFKSTDEFQTGSFSPIFDQLVPKIFNRGPDSSNVLVTDNICFYSSVLSLRSPFTPQPIHDDRFVIQFNGELYNEQIGGNDTRYIRQLLSSNTVEDTIHLLDGEFAFTVYDKHSGCVYFGRDPIGKRSLVYKVDEEGLTISSVNPLAERDQFKDCLNGAIYKYQLHTNTLEIDPSIMTVVINDKTDHNMAHLEQRLDSLSHVLTKSVEQRIRTIQPLHIVDDHDALFSILFSGGLDCTVIAALCAQLSADSTTIDLLNVAFDNPRTGLLAKDAPDRQLAINSWKCLQLKFPNISFNLITIDVPFEVYSSLRPRVIELMYPKNTEMDLSIAIAFYFASRGQGQRLRLENGTIVNHGDHQSRAKVLLSGLGADELYGGYHKFANKDLETLVPELQRQINNIHERNLQRDDKVIADNGVEVRYPFLSEQVIAFSTNGIEINYKVSKFILRQLALRLGLEFVSEEPKRAIQFGAKSAKITKDSKKKGTDVL